MKKAVLIIEDDIEQLERLKQLVMEVNGNTEVYMAGNAAQAYEILLEKTIDVFLIDIVLNPSIPGDVSGIQLVERLRKIPKYFFAPVIFVTSVEDQEIHAYKKLNCFGYIEKPYHSLQVRERIERALYYTTEREKDVEITLKKDNILYFVRVKDIVYVESIRHVLYFHCMNGEELDIPYLTCKRILGETDGRLLQCARGVLVNRDYVFGFDLTNRYLIMRDNMGMLLVGEKYKKKLMKELDMNNR